MDRNLPQIPFVSIGDKVEKALLRIVAPKIDDPEERDIPLRFNPTSYALEKTSIFASVVIPGLDTPPIQYLSGGPQMLKFDALLDTSETLKDVREEYVDRLTDLMKINTELHAPPIVDFFWGRTVFRGVLSSLTVKYVLFTPKGVPMRAEATLALTAYRPIEEQIAERPRNSPDVEKSRTVRRGDRLDQIADGVYQDPARWRDIARRNGIADPRRLDPGQVLLLPRIVRGRGA